MNERGATGGARESSLLRTGACFSLPALGLLLFGLYAQSVSAGNLYEVKHSYQADVKVFVVKYEYQADLCVFVAEHDYEAKGKDAVWYWVKYPYQADVKVFFVHHEYEADLKVYFVKHEYEAGWRKSNPLHGRLH
jgi:hypothetical protein